MYVAQYATFVHEGVGPNQELRLAVSSRMLVQTCDDQIALQKLF
ncbi:hypothetical protein N8Z04_00795 [bacterium]|nr:hypothetical protein [bacterium]